MVSAAARNLSGAVAQPKAKSRREILRVATDSQAASLINIANVAVRESSGTLLG